MTATTISWAQRVWNPTTGCDRVTPGCDHCYALTMARRLKGMGSAKYQRDGDPRTSGPGFGITEHPDTLDTPLHWKAPKRIFVNSMSDLLHAGVSDEFVARVFASMALAPQHTFQLLTKRHGRLRALLSSAEFEQSVRLKVEHHDELYSRTIANWPLPNVWVGVSVEDQARADVRLPALEETPAAVRWASCEPLLAAVNATPWLSRGALDWVVLGGESGAGARPMHIDWARSLRDQCSATGVPFHFKQWGAHIPLDHAGGIYGGIRDVLPDGTWSPHDRARTDRGVATVPFRPSYRHGRELDGRTWDEYPAVSSR